VSAAETQKAPREPHDEPRKGLPPSLRIALRALQAAALVGLILAAATARVIVAGEREIALSTAALRASDPHAAALHARRAAGWYAPGAPHVRVAYERLIALATAAEGLGDRETALFAWNGVRTAAIETQWLLTPHEEDLTRANQAIARISAAIPGPISARNDPPQVIERKHFETLARDEAPRTAWIAALVLAFVLWTGGAAWTSRRALTPSGRLLGSKALPGLAALALGIGVWLLAFWRA
jgi:hypothetical protein